MVLTGERLDPANLSADIWLVGWVGPLLFYSYTTTSTPFESCTLLSRGDVPEPAPERREEEDRQTRLKPRGNADVIGVADGVGGWRQYGVDPGLFSSNLMKVAANSYCISKDVIICISFRFKFVFTCAVVREARARWLLPGKPS